MIALGCDHGGYDLMQEVMAHLDKRGIEYKNFGTFTKDSCDYPEYAKLVAGAVVDGTCEKGILICGTGIGMSICANKVKGVRCAHVTNIFCAEVTRQHNDTNMIALGARINTVEEIVSFVDKFLTTKFDGGRHETRVGKIMAYEQK